MQATWALGAPHPQRDVIGVLYMSLHQTWKWCCRLWLHASRAHVGLTCNTPWTGPVSVNV